MRTMKPFLILVSCLAMFSPATLDAYVLGIFPSANNYREIASIEKERGISIPMAGFIFDTFTESDAKTLENAVRTVGTGTVYHVTVSPYGLSAKSVSEGAYDREYRRFFRVVKDSGAKFVFRTMHEMNGSWYSWSGHPADFKKAWRHVWNLSRESGLDRKNVLFAFSVNSEDLPSTDGNVGWTLLPCTSETREKTGCFTFENFYPGSRYVDTVGMSAYNWWRGRSEPWARWKEFSDILDDGGKNSAFNRLKRFHKPIFIDEAGTTGVNFDGEWKNDAVLERYENDTVTKNAWLSNFSRTLSERPEIFGALYFNRDKTRGLTDRSLVGELDWRAIGVGNERTYARLVEAFRDPQSQTVGLLPFERAKTTKKPSKPAEPSAQEMKKQVP